MGSIHDTEMGRFIEAQAIFLERYLNERAKVKAESDHLDQAAARLFLDSTRKKRVLTHQWTGEEVLQALAEQQANREE